LCANFQDFDRQPRLSKKSLKGQWLRLISPRCVNAEKPARLFVTRAQDLAGLWVNQMRLCARKARHLNVSEVIVIGIVSRPSLDVVACVGAAIEEW